MATHVGVMRLVLDVPGARSLKDRRRAVVSLRDRVRHRFPVTWNDVDEGGGHDVAVVVCTSASTDPRLLRSTFDSIRALVASSGKAYPRTVDVDVFPWHPAERRWSDVQDADDDWSSDG